MTDPIWGDAPRWRTDHGRDQYLRGYAEIARALGVSREKVKTLINDGTLPAFRAGYFYHSRVRDVQAYIVAQYKNECGDLSGVIKRLPYHSREKLVELYNAADLDNMVRASLQPSHKVSLINRRPLLWSMGDRLYRISDLGDEVARALIGDELLRKRKHTPHNYNRTPPPITLTKISIRALTLLSYTTSATHKDLEVMQIKTATIVALKNKGLVRVLPGLNTEARAYAITDRGRAYMKERRKRNHGKPTDRDH
jgi:excisionase family DNA binding protein